MEEEFSVILKNSSATGGLMKIIYNKIEKRISYFRIENNSEDMELFSNRAYKRLTRKTNVPNYSNGELSFEDIEKQIGSDKILEEIINDITHEAYLQAIIDYELESDMQPVIKIIQKNPLVLEMIIPLKPLVKLCDYHSLKMEPESLDISDEEVNTVLEGLRKQYATLSSAEGLVQEGVGAIIDVKGEISGISFLNKQGIKFIVTPEYSLELPGLYKELIGMSKGEEKEFRLRFPESYVRKEAAGKDADYKVKVNEILKQVLPEINDELANRIAPGVKTIEALKDRIKINMRREREENAKPRFENKLMDTLIRESEIEYPQVMLDMQMNGLIAQYKQELQASSSSGIEYNKKLKETPDNVLRERVRPLAEKRILWSLVINEVAKVEGIEVTESEIDKEIQSVLNELGGDEREQDLAYYNDYQNRQDVQDLLKARKTIDKLTEIVKASSKH